MKSSLRDRRWEMIGGDEEPRADPGVNVILRIFKDEVSY